MTISSRRCKTVLALGALSAVAMAGGALQAAPPEPAATPTRIVSAAPHVTPGLHQQLSERSAVDDHVPGVELFTLPDPVEKALRANDDPGRKRDRGIFRASDLIGTSVYAVDGGIVGEIDDILVSVDGEVQGVVIGVGGFLGLGEKRVAIRYDRIETVETSAGDRLLLDVSEDELDRAPQFMSHAIIEMERAYAREHGDEPEAPYVGPPEHDLTAPSDSTD